MANLVDGKLPPPAGMTYAEFSEYALYLTLREFLRAMQGQQAVLSLDASYQNGSKINPEALLAHPMGKLVAALGRAMHEGAVLPGWDNVAGKMNWGKFSSFVRWFARLNRTQQALAISRMRSGSETPWVAPRPVLAAAAAPEVAPVNPSVPGGNAGLTAMPADSSYAIEKPSEGLGTAGWLAILAAIAAVGFVIYRMLSANKPAPEEPS